MRLGLSMPYARPDGSAPSATEVIERARLIERVGFDGIWFGETIGRGKAARPDILTWLTLCAVGTEKVDLGTSILQVPLRHPTELAMRLMTLSVVSGGRFCAGLGAGSTRDDYDAVGVDFERRFTLLDQGLKTLKGLLAGERVGDANLYPWPNAMGGPPIFIGAWESGLWVKRAARNYDGWMASGRGTSMRGLEEGMHRFKDAGGKRALVMTVSVDLSAPGHKLAPDEPFSLVCGPEEAAERLHWLADLGYDDVGLVRFGHTSESFPESELRQIRALYSA